MRVLVTGASGFVGHALTLRLCREQEVTVRAARRGSAVELPAGIESAAMPDLTADADWMALVRDCTSVVHAAARVHTMDDSAADPLAEFRAVNVAGTLRLARAAAQAGVRRFVFVSSIKVNGEQTESDHPFTPHDAPAPVDAYGISKLEAEQGLQELARDTGMELVVLRPVLVYGPGVKANFRAMMQSLHRGVPLPLGAIHNRRSLVALDNMVDLVVRCLTHDAAANQTFLVGDGEDLSTTELLRRTALAMGKPARLIPVPAVVMQTAARLFGKGDLARRLCGSLTVDITKNREVLGWTPPVSVDRALATTVADFLEHAGR